MSVTPPPPPPPPPLRPRAGKTRLRPFTWIILIVQGLFVAWIISAVIAINGEETCAVDTYGDACEAGRAVGIALSVFVILFFWALVDVILGVIWVVTNRKNR